MKEWFSQTCVYTLKEYILYQVTCQSKTTKLLFTMRQLCVFFREKCRQIVLGHRGNKRGTCNQLFYES